MLKRLPLLSLLLAAAAALGGCDRYLAREVRILAVQTAIYGTAGADMRLQTANRGDRPLRLTAAEMRLAYDGREILHATLRDTATVAAHWQGEVTTRWRLQVPDRAALYAVQRKLQRAETQRLKIAFVLHIDVGQTEKKIVRQMPMSRFLNTFGLRPEDLFTDFE